MANAQDGDTVKVDYTGKLADGTVFDSTEDREPLEFQIGADQVIPGFEQAVKGMEPGQTKTETIPAEEAYGERSQAWMVTVDRDELPADMELQEGQHLEIEDESGQRRVVCVADVAPDKVTLDANHPLAGEDLTFEITLVEIA